MNPSFDPLKPSREEAARHAEYVIDLAKKLADGTRPGVLATADEHGMPHMRWMATLSLRDWPLLYAITSPDSRKIQHIKRNSRVSWMFSNDELSIIINIRGKARIADDSGKMQQVWKLLEDKSKAYFLSIDAEGSGFAVIETEIQDVECILPKYDIKFQAHHVGLGLFSRSFID